MSNILRPTFGPPKPPEPAPDDWRPIDKIGEAAGYIVGITRAEGETGPVIRVVIGQAAGTAIVTVGLYPDEEDAEQDARACAFAVLRALEVVGGEHGPMTA